MSNLRTFASRLAWDLCRLIPVKNNRIVFCSYYGRGYSDSPKAICEALRKSGEELDLLWLCKDEKAAQTLPDGVRAVPNRGMAHMIAMASSKVWVDNCRKYELGKKDNQFYLQTWHGFALKKIEADCLNSLEDSYISACKTDSAQCDLYISGSGFMTRLYQSSFWYDGPVLETGTPRNDLLFADRGPIRRKVCQAFGLPESQKIALYAPTFRDDHNTRAYSLDPHRALLAAEERFSGEWSALIRLHPNVTAQSKDLFNYDGSRIIDATLYPDMMELLCAADLLITDYSSSMFDFALTGRPVVQYAPDLEEYKANRDFYFPIDSLPFPLAADNFELERCLKELVALDDSPAWRAFQKQNGFCEDGRSSERCAALILEKLRK